MTTQIIHKCENRRIVWDGEFYRDIDHGGLAVNYCGDCGVQLEREKGEANVTVKLAK